MFFPPIFLYISKINIPSIPKITPPRTDMIGMKEFNPNKKSINAGKQVITNACQCLIPRSYIKTFLKMIPCAIKAVTVAKAPIKRETEINDFGRKSLSPIKPV